jgi:purine-binding chemotaxis protein CheW
MPPDSQSIATGLGLDNLDRPAASENTKQFVTFTLGEAEYGIDIMVVREIKGWTDTTMIPNAPTYVRGVVNLRGVIVPIFDLRARFGLGLTVPTKMHVVIIVASGSRTIGLLVDTVSDIISIDPKAIRPVPEMGLPTEDQFLDGLVAMDNRMVTLVSLAGLFNKRAADPVQSDARGTTAETRMTKAA